MAVMIEIAFDPFSPTVEQTAVQQMWGIVDSGTGHTYVIRTSHPWNVRRMWPEIVPCGQLDPIASAPYDSPIRKYRKNVWLLTSVSDQATADAAIPHLLACRDLVPVLGLSVEPLLGPVDLSRWLTREIPCGDDDALVRMIDWCIVGGESGPHARPCRVDWIQSIVQQCRAAGVKVFVKQLGANVHSMLPSGEVWPGGNGLPESGAVRFVGDGFGNYQVTGLRDPKGGDPSEWPEDSRVREFPEVTR